jgi:hypothetical protein
MLWLVMLASGSCQLLPGFSSASRTDRHQPTRRARTVQDAFDRVTVANAAGGPMPFLAVDGICGSRC